MSRNELPNTYHYAALSYLPGGRQDFPQDAVAQHVRTLRAPSTFKRRPAVAGQEVK